MPFRRWAVFTTAMSGAQPEGGVLDAISIQGQACTDARRHNGNELLFCSQIALADFSCFLTLQGTVSPTLICLCGRFRPCVGFTIGTVAPGAFPPPPYRMNTEPGVPGIEHLAIETDITSRSQGCLCHETESYDHRALPRRCAIRSRWAESCGWCTRSSALLAQVRGTV